MKTVTSICRDFTGFCDSDLAGKVERRHVEQIADILINIPRQQETHYPKFTLEGPNVDEEDVFLDHNHYLSDRLKGWNK